MRSSVKVTGGSNSNRWEYNIIGEFVKKTWDH